MALVYFFGLVTLVAIGASIYAHKELRRQEAEDAEDTLE